MIQYLAGLYGSLVCLNYFGLYYCILFSLFLLLLCIIIIIYDSNFFTLLKSPPQLEDAMSSDSPGGVTLCFVDEWTWTIRCTSCQATNGHSQMDMCDILRLCATFQTPSPIRDPMKDRPTGNPAHRRLWLKMKIEYHAALIFCAFARDFSSFRCIHFLWLNSIGKLAK